MARKKLKKSRKGQRLRFDIRDERIIKILGIVSIFLGIYLTIAFTSYFFTWRYDQDKVLALSGQLLFNGDINVQNWLGRLGAFTSHFFFYWGFGLSSFIFVLLFVQLGIDLIRKQPLAKFFNLFLHSFLLICFISVILEFATRDSEFSWGGLMGYTICNYLINFLGTMGLVLLLAMLVFASVIWVVNPMLELQGTRLDGLGDKVRIPKMDFIAESISGFFATQEETPKTLKPKKAKKKHGLFGNIDKEVEGVMPKTDEGGSGTVGQAISLDLPQFKAEPKPKSDAASKNSKEGGPDLELELAEPISDQPVPPSDNAQVRVPDMDSTKLYVEEENLTDFEPYDPTKELSKFQMPQTDLLESYPDNNTRMDRVELEENKNQIIKTLLNYKIEITKIKATIGPTVTLYEIVPAPGVKISKIKSLENDIALSLSALGIRIIAPIPGKGTIGIEVPNKNKQIVSFKEVVASDKFKNAKMDLPIVLGKTISNEVFVADLAKMPHLLIAGATGQGKSVGINTILMSILYKKHPSQVKLVMVDPKKVELFPYSSLDNHYLGFLPTADEPITTDTKEVVKTLNSLTMEMDERYDLLKKGKARNIKEYNEKFITRKIKAKDGHRFLPYIVLVIDEFADLIMTAGKEIELPLARLAQLARAIGIHLIIATQRPSVKIITGMIKANFPARISYKVTSLQDSRTILDSKGAEQLIGKGDMLLSVGSDMVRLQCAFVDTPEVERVIDHISTQKGFVEPYHLPDVPDDNAEIGGTHLKWSELDPMFEEAARMIVGSQHGSTSMLQRKLQLGYNRAGRIMDQLESVGIVGETNGSKPRQVLFTSEMELTHYLEHLKGKN